MDFNLTTEQQQIREEIRKVCGEFPDAYWRQVDRDKAYPEAFVKKLSELGWLAALIPEEYGGTGLGITEASIILEEINHSGGVATACHAQMYTMGTLLRHGNAEQKRRYLPRIATGELRLQAFGVTEPNAGSESTRIQTSAVRKGDKYLIDGQKIFISRVLQSDLMLLLARTTPYDELQDKTRGLSVFIVDLRENKGKLEVKPLELMINHHTNALFFDQVEVPVENLIGDEGMGFRYIIDGWNAERILVAAEAIGDGRWFTERQIRQRTQRLRQAHRLEPGGAISHRQGLRQHRSRRSRALPGGHEVRPKRKMRRGSQSREVSRLGSGMGSRQCLSYDPWRLRLRGRVRYREKVQGNQATEHCAREQ
jgi:acyl-CoA dehydrogenase